MKKTIKGLYITISLLLVVTFIMPYAQAKTFAPEIDTTNFGVNSQYSYEENDPSWLRELTVKEDMLSTSGLMNAAILYPVPDYPYTTDAKTFKKTVEDSIELYTLTEDSQKAAYLYFLEQIGALSILTEPETPGTSKADWLRAQGIVVTPEDEADPDKILMISALYALMKNDFYYVYTGKTLTIPAGTPLEEAVVMYLSALSGNNETLTKFVQKFFGTASLGNLEDYIFYTSLMTLYTTGYVTTKEISTISREEVFRRVAIMTIRNAGISIDAETATTEEIQEKYLTALLGVRFSVTLDTDTLIYNAERGSVPFYILQKMGEEDCGLTISNKKYTYEECFTTVAEKTQRFDLENEFYSDIREYNVYLEHLRSNISINPNPLTASGTKIYINGTKVPNGSYSLVPLTGEAMQTIKITCDNTTNGVIKSTTYLLNIHQGKTAGPDSDITGIVPTLGDINLSSTNINPTLGLTGPSLGNGMSNINDAVSPLLNNILTFNENGQLVDGNGNIVNNQVYETLPSGFQYALDDNGAVVIVPVTQSTTEPTTGESTKNNAEKTNKIIMIVSAVTIVLLACAIPIVMRLSNNKEFQQERLRKRKQRETAKKEKQFRKK